MRVVAAEAGSSRYTVSIRAVRCGPDLCVCIGGGTHPHIGAAALGLPCPSLQDPARRSASVSVLNVVGHKEDALVKDAAQDLATVFGCRVSVAAGLHLDSATQEDIRVLWENYRSALNKLKEQLKGDSLWSQR